MLGIVLFSWMAFLTLGHPHAALAENGITDTEIKLGMVNAQTGPSAGLGKGMRMGAEAVFKEVNAKGGINGRKINLIVADDAYDPNKTIDETVKMIEEQKVFCLFGYVGAPTTAAVIPILKDTHVPLIGLFTGNLDVRKPLNPDIINIRAGYDEEAEALVAYYYTKGARKFALFQQSNAVLYASLERSLKKRGLSFVAVGSFPKDTMEINTGLVAILPKNPDVVIMAGPYAPLAAFVKAARANNLKADLATYSFVGADNFLNAVGEVGEGVVISQVVPFPGDTGIPIVNECREILAKQAPGEKLGYVSLEGAITAKALVMALEKAGKDLSRPALINTIESFRNVDMGGMVLNVSKDDHQASYSVFLTQIQHGKIVPIK